MMVPWRLSLLLLAALTLHACLSAQSEVSDGRSRRDIIALYNQREGVTYLYKALEEEETADRRNLIIKETKCLKSDNQDVSQCDYKPDGDVRICSLDLGDVDSEDIRCSSLTQGIRVKRSRQRPCRRRPCGNRLTGGGSLVARPANNNNKINPQLNWV
ncbi:uncharacterized protein RB166_021241 [Leptodactylus fuscus]